MQGHSLAENSIKRKKRRKCKLEGIMRLQERDKQTYLIYFHELKFPFVISVIHCIS